MTPAAGGIARHIDILAIGAVLLCYGAFTAAQTGFDRWRALHPEGRTTIERFERRHVAPVRVYFDSRHWLRKA